MTLFKVKMAFCKTVQLLQVMGLSMPIRCVVHVQQPFHLRAPVPSNIIAAVVVRHGGFGLCIEDGVANIATCHYFGRLPPCHGGNDGHGVISTNHRWFRRGRKKRFSREDRASEATRYKVVPGSLRPLQRDERSWQVLRVPQLLEKKKGSR